MAQATPAVGSAPTVVLVHGAFADASGWGGGISRLQFEPQTPGPRMAACRPGV